MPSKHRRGSALHGNAGEADSKGVEERTHLSTQSSPVKSKLLSIAPHSKPSHVVATVENCAPIVVAAKKLKSQARFQAVCLYRFKIEMVFDGNWSTIVAEARRIGGAA